MVERLRIGIAQFLARPGDGAANLASALGHIATLARQGCQLIVLPELWPSGFSWATLADDAHATAEPLDGPRGHALAAAARNAGGWLLAGSVPETDGGALYNTALLYDASGALVTTHRKVRLYTPLGEDTAFSAGDAFTVADLPGLGRVGVATCFDGDFPEIARSLRRAGARIVLHPSAYELAASAWWDTLYPANALANGQWWISANQCGATPSGTLLGASRVITPLGVVTAEATRAAEGQTPPAHELVVDVALRAGIDAWDAGCAALLERAEPVPATRLLDRHSGL